MKSNVRAVIRGGAWGALASPEFVVSEKRIERETTVYHYQHPQI